MTRTARHLLGILGLLSASLAGNAVAQVTVTDDAGRRVLVPAVTSRIYAAGPPASILLFALAPDKLLGWTTYFREPERPFIPSQYASLPVLGRLTGRGNTANVETVLAARPNLIFDYGTVNPTFASLADRVQQQTGLPYLLLDGSFPRMADSIERLGMIIGEPAKAAELAGWVRSQLADLDARLAGLPLSQRPRVYYGRGPRGLDTGLAGSINTEILERAGAVNVASELGTGGLVQVSLEQVIAWKPEVIVTIDPTFYASLESDPLWRTIPAVRSGRAYLAPNVPFGWVDFPPSINRLVGLRWLAHILHPDRFPEDLRDYVRDFYRRLYHRVPDEAQLDFLLRSTMPLAR